MTHPHRGAALTELPPARGEAVQAPPALRYVAIGDSIPRGFLLGPPGWAPPGVCTAPQAWLLRWFDRPDRGYPALAARALRAAGTPVELDMSLTCTNSCSAAFWRGGPTAPVRRVFDRPAQLVSVTVGANDVMGGWSAYVAAASAAPVAPALRWDPQPVLDRLAPRRATTGAAVDRLQARLHDLLGWLVRHTDGPVVITTYHRGDESEVVRTRLVNPVNAAIRAAATGVPGCGWWTWRPCSPVTGWRGPPATGT
ncbi:MAG: hypothetical protein U0Y82_02800 [Thermoleophilia bacterium]